MLKGRAETLKITRHIALELHYPSGARQVSDFLKERGFEVKVIRSYLYAKKMASNNMAEGGLS